MNGDKFDPVTGTKIKGYWDHEKLTEWRGTIEKVLKKRLDRKKQKSADFEYFESRPGTTMVEGGSRISRDSLQFFEALDTGKKLANQIEF